MVMQMQDRNVKYLPGKKWLFSVTIFREIMAADDTKLTNLIIYLVCIAPWKTHKVSSSSDLCC